MNQAVVAVADVAPPTFHPIAIAVGETWASELMRSLRLENRGIVGGWPGTLREARMRIRLAVRTKLDIETLEELARIAYLAARRGWSAVSEPDPEV